MTELMNKTSNQHFISQTEFRWNSAVPDAPHGSIKINRFRLINKRDYKLSQPERKRVKGLSCGDDLFTIAIMDDGKRVNMEKFFGYFEEQYNNRASNFLSAIKNKIDDSVAGVDKIDGSEFYSDVKFFQKMKFLNFIRNPHNICQALKMFDFAKDFIVHGQGGEFKLIFNALVKNEKKHRDFICKTYKVSESDFDSWIKLILLFVYHDENMKNPVLDGMMEEFFKAKELYTAVIIGYYLDESKGAVLIPDVGSVVYSDMTYKFNVSKNCFIALEHNLIDSEYSRDIARNASERMGLKFTEDVYKEFKRLMAGHMSISIYVDNEELLRGYNRGCIEASAEFVYSCSTTIHGADVVREGSI
ncbi:hypothetical protein [Kosakonia pseudosacchari]|uniref:hypothetical protein n=1 Tax=Kosakonia pseudosacchari TaxID=1646340 RepID=UPI00188306A8|nr:hypothetical protein [Kosakonia pseudosacchari]QOV66521.1 hypothetical protein IP581_23560 [Kosakonia pseudosacchari]